MVINESYLAILSRKWDSSVVTMMKTDKPSRSGLLPGIITVVGGIVALNVIAAVSPTAAMLAAGGVIVIAALAMLRAILRK